MRDDSALEDALVKVYARRSRIVTSHTKVRLRSEVLKEPPWLVRNDVLSTKSLVYRQRATVPQHRVLAKRVAARRSRINSPCPCDAESDSRLPPNGSKVKVYRHRAVRSIPQGDRRVGAVCADGRHHDVAVASRHNNLFVGVKPHQLNLDPCADSGRSNGKACAATIEVTKVALVLPFLRDAERTQGGRVLAANDDWRRRAGPALVEKPLGGSTKDVHGVFVVGDVAHKAVHLLIHDASKRANTSR